jgi:GT2 family glycosyltransferase
MSDHRRERVPGGGPVVGIVVIGRNEGDRLRACLASAKREGCRIVYVDSGSRDDSVACARRLDVAVVELDGRQPFTAARARNAGFALLCDLVPGLAYVQFVDGDCTLVPDWMEAAATFLEGRPDVAAVCGRRRERYPERSPFNLLCDMEWDTPIGETRECGGDVLVRTRVFRDAGGYRATLIAGEEPELCLRLRQGGWVIWRLCKEMTVHDAAMTRFSQWWRRAARAGYAFAEVSRLHRGRPVAIWQNAVPRAVFWGGLMPLFLVVGTAIQPVWLGLGLLYPLQICRVARNRGFRTPGAWTYGCFVLLGKLPELQGVLSFHVNRWRGRIGGLIEYKQA